MSSCHIIFIHNYSRKNYRNPSRTPTLLHVWRAKPCMTTSSSHQEPDDENVCRHLTHHRKAKHQVKRSLWEGVRCVGKAKLQKRVTQARAKSSKIQQGPSCLFRHFISPHSRELANPEIKNYELFNLASSMTSSFVTWLFLGMSHLDFYWVLLKNIFLGAFYTFNDIVLSV